MIAISLPFRIDGYGKVSTSSTLEKIWADRVRTVIATTLMERVLRPTYGSDVTSTLFDAMADAPGLLEESISSAFVDWLPDLTLVAVSLVDENEADGSLQVLVEYELPNQQSQTTSVGVSYNIGGTGTTVEAL